MRPMDDVWSESSNPQSPTTNHFQNFFTPQLRSPSPTTTTTISFIPPPSPTTMLTLLTTTNNNSNHQDPYKRLKPNPPVPLPPAPVGFTPEYSEKDRKLMKIRESAAKSRARKKARADELEQEVMRLAKENAKLKKLQRQMRVSQAPKESRLSRTKSAPF